MILGTLVQGNPADNLIDRMISRTMPTHYENDRVSGTLRWRAFATNTGLNTVSLPNMTSIGYGCFLNCTGLQSAYMPNCTYVSGYAFQSCTNLTSVNIAWGSVKQIVDYGLDNTPKLSFNLSNSIITSIGICAMRSCGIRNVELTACSYLSNQAFQSSKSLITANFPACTTTGTLLFHTDTALTTAKFEALGGYIEARMFDGCTNLATISFPLTGGINSNVFYNCTALTSVTFPRCSQIAQQCFASCKNLHTVCLNWVTSTVGYISSQAFLNCFNLLSLYILGSSVMALSNINAFTSTPISNYTTSTGGVYGSIYVPQSLYSSYIASTNWVTYADRFVSLTDAQILDIRGDWTQSMSATFSYPQSSPIFYNSEALTNDEHLKQYLSVTATHYDGTTHSLNDEDYIITGVQGFGTKLFYAREGALASFYCVMTKEFELPEEYERVGYIQTSGTQYISTEITPTITDTMIAFAAQGNTWNGNFGVIATYDGANYYGIVGYANYFRGYYGSSGVVMKYLYPNGIDGTFITTNQDNIFTTYPNANIYVRTSDSTITRASTVPNLSYFVGAVNSNGTAANMREMRIWYVEIPNRLQLIPCKRKSDNVLGMYDLKGNICSLTNTPFFINAGTGSFTYGYNP